MRSSTVAGCFVLVLCVNHEKRRSRAALGVPKDDRDGSDQDNDITSIGGGGKAESAGAPEHAPPFPSLLRNETPNALAFDFEQGLVPFVNCDALRKKTFIAESHNGVVFSAELQSTENEEHTL